jgi:hypothetical protein
LYLYKGKKMELIENALRPQEELSFDKLAKLAGYTKEEQKWASIFWEPAFNGSWLYLSDEAVSWLGYNGDKHARRNCIRELKNSFTEYEDYEIVDQEHKLAKSIPS